MIRLQDVQKSFLTGSGRSKRRIEAVRGVSLVAPDGEITALLGPNGAGKTTTLRMISTLVAPDAGVAEVDTMDCVKDAVAARRALGVLSDARGLYVRLTARENIRYYGRLRGMDEVAIDKATERLAELIDLSPLLDRRTEGFSQGERMKVAIARALVHDPKNLVLDEPTNGLDIMSVRALRSLLDALAQSGKCILMSSHIMQEVSHLASRVVVLSEGRTIAEGTPEELIALAGTTTLEDAFVALSVRAEEQPGAAT